MLIVNEKLRYVVLFLVGGVIRGLYNRVEK